MDWDIPTILKMTVTAIKIVKDTGEAYRGLRDKLKSLLEKDSHNEKEISKAIDEIEAGQESKRETELLEEKIASMTPEAQEAIQKVVDAILTSKQPEPKEIITATQPKQKEIPETQAEDLDVPRFDFFREIPPTKTIYTKGIQFTDKDPEGVSGPPKLYLSVYFKDSKYFVGHPLSTNEKWLYLEANMRPALNLRVQVRAWHMRDVDELMNFLRNSKDGWDLHGPRTADEQAGDYFYVWRENDENRLMISTFTPTNAGISIHARFSDEVAKAFADYLERIGFTNPI